MEEHKVAESDGAAAGGATDLVPFLDELMTKFPEPAAHPHVRLLLDEVVYWAATNVLRPEQTRALLTTVADVVAGDAACWQRTAAQSFAALQASMLALSVERPPRSSGVFEPSTAVAAVELMLALYYRRFKLYKYCCSSVPDAQLTQTAAGGVEPPRAAKPLADAILVAPLR